MEYSHRGSGDAYAEVGEWWRLGIKEPQLQSHIVAANPRFDLASSIQARIIFEDAALQPANHLFSLSPLTSPECTPPPSPQTTPISLPAALTSNSPAARRQSATIQQPSSSKALLSPSLQPIPPKKVLLTPSGKVKGRKAAKKATSHAQRKKKREAELGFGHYVRRDNVIKRYVDHSKPVRCEMATELASVQSTGFVAEDDGSLAQKEYRLDEMVGENSKFKFQLVTWDGRTPTPVVDKSRRVVAVLAGHPEVENWPQLQQQAAEALEERRLRCIIPRNKRKHRRGRFVALQCGVSHGGGQRQPCNMANNTQNGNILNELNDLAPFKRMAGFASACMATWAPDLYQHYADHMGPLYAKNPSLKPAFPSCIFSAATYNFGPRTVCYKHRDFNNLAFGWCAVWSLGPFDPRKGGHLILWDCHLVIEFPPGSAILLPSSIVAHSNTPIASHERRYSFALYTAGALFRWVENRFMKAEDYLNTLSPQQLDIEKEKNANRWMDGVALLPKLKACSD